VTVDIVKRGTGQGSPWDDEFTRYFGTRMRSLRLTAYSLCHDWHQAEDITQLALLKLYRVWPRLDHERGIDAFARKVVERTFLNECRRPWRGRERLTDALPEFGAAPDGLEERSLVLDALSGVAPKQQQVLVMRFLHDMSVEETAEELGLSTGTVKSQSARGLATLRKRLGPHFAALAAAAAAAAAIIAIVVGIASSATSPKPVEPAVPPETTTTTTPSPTSESVSEPTSSSTSNEEPPQSHTAETPNGYF
jgi:RNA polymerase sigma-70 factor (sigma-E family)